jgi:hypothetical protein
MTLIELLLVMGILAVMLGMGLGTFASLNPGERAAVGLVQNALRTAHNTAVARSAPARVRLDRATGSIVTTGVLMIGTWHFEDHEFRGVDGMDGVLVGWDDALVEKGYLGRALSFVGAPQGARFEVPVESDPAYNFREGFFIELSLRPDEHAGAQLLALGDAFEANVTADGGVNATLHRREIDPMGVARRGGGVTVETGSGLLRAGRWTVLRFQYDRRSFRILADGVQVAAAYSDVPVWDIRSALVLAGGTRPLRGSVDELVIAAFSGEERAALTGGVVFTEDCPKVVEFVAGGALDPAVHPGPLKIGLEFSDGRREDILVGLYGTVE